MIAAISGLALAATAQQMPLAARFHPAEGQSYRYVTRQTRSDGTTTRSFTTERRLVFTRQGDGWRAEITLERTGQTAGGDVGSMFEAAMATLVDRPIRFGLDRDGNLLLAEGVAMLWADMMDALDAMVAHHTGTRTADAHAITSRMRALPAARQSSFIASLLTPLIDTGAAGRMPGTRAVGIPAVSPLGSPMTLAGEESVAVEPGGALSIVTHASGIIAPLVPAGLPGADIAPPAATASAMVRVATERRIDPASGLLLSSRDENATCADVRHPSSCVSTLTEVTLMSPVL